MAAPKTYRDQGGAGFDCCDWFYDAANTVDTATSFDACLTDAAHGILGQPDTIWGGAITVSGDNLQFSNAASLIYNNPVTSTFTFEVAFDLKTASLPAALSSGVSFGVCNTQGLAFRIALATTGLGFIPGLSGDAQKLSGTTALTAVSSISATNDWLVIRAICIGSKIELRCTRTQGSVSKVLYVFAPEVTSVITTDHIDVVCAHSSSFILGSLRLSTINLVPNQRPVAIISVPEIARVGSLTQLSGAGSYDPEGAPITFTWRIVTAPTEATPVLEGMVQATALINNGVSDLLQIVTTYMGADGNDRTVTISGGASLSLAVVAGNLEIVVPAGFALKNLELAINNSLKFGQPAEVSELFTATMLTSGAEAIPYSPPGVPWVFSGGIDSDLAEPTFTPTAEGLYEFELIVNDGAIDSEAALVSISVMASAHLLETIPDGKIIWRALPDFWNTVTGDKDVFPEIWSGMMQVVAGDLYKAWQDDYAKSIRDVPPVYQRKWVGYNTKIDISATPTGYPGFHQAYLELQDDLDDDLSSALVLAAPGELLADFAYWVVLLSRDTAFIRLISPTSPTSGTLSTEIPTYEEIGAGTRSGIVDSAAPYLTFRLLNGVFPVSDCQSGDILRINGLDYLIDVASMTDTTLVIDPAPPIGSHPYYNSPRWEPTFETALTPGSFYDWKIIRQLSSGFVTIYCPYIPVTEAIPYSVLELTATIGSTTITSTAPVIACDEERAFVDWGLFCYTVLAGIDRTSLLTTTLDPALKTFIFQYNDGKIPQPMGLCEYFDKIFTTATHIIYPTHIPVPETLLSVPHLQDEIGRLDVAVYKQYEDYELEEFGGKKYLLWSNRAAVTVTWEGYDVTFSPALDEPTDVIELDIGPFLAPFNWSQDNSGNWVAKVATYALSTVTLSAYIPESTEVPHVYWAELSSYSNNETIDTNFGAAIGYPYVDQVNYKSGTTALWFAFWFGPRLTNIEIAVQACLDRKLFLVDGTVTKIEEHYTASLGRIFIEESGNSGQTHTYTYDTVLGLATHPSTGLPYAQGDVIHRYWPICGGITAEDYKSDPEWFDRFCAGEEYLKRFHHFVVKIRGSVDADDIDRMYAFLDQLKPQYTDVLIVQVDLQRDDIDVQDILKYTVHLLHDDNLAPAYYTQPSLDTGTLTDYDFTTSTCEDNAKVWTVGEHDGRLVFFDLQAPSTKNWTVITTNTATTLVLAEALDLAGTENYEIKEHPETVFPHRFPVVMAAPAVAGLAADNVEVYESGYMAGRADDYSGDGSWHPNAPIEPVTSGTLTGVPVGAPFTFTDAANTFDTLTSVCYVYFDDGSDTWAQVISGSGTTFTTGVPTLPGGAPAPIPGIGVDYYIHKLQSRVERVNKLDTGDEDYSKSLIWIWYTRIPGAEFQLNEWINNGNYARARILYIATLPNQAAHPDADYLLCQRRPLNDADSLPMGSEAFVDFLVGDTITGETSGASAGVDGVSRFVVPIFAADSGTAVPKSHPGILPEVYISENGMTSGADMGLVADDTQPYRTPPTGMFLDPSNEIPSMYLGQYWWLDCPVVTDFIADPTLPAVPPPAPPGAWIAPELSVYGPAHPTIGGGSVFALTPTRFYVPAMPGSISTGMQLLVFTATIPGNNGMWAINAIDPGGAWIDLLGAAFVDDPNNGNLEWIVQPSWWQSYGWGNVDPSYVMRNKYMFRYELYGDHYPQLTHGFTYLPLEDVVHKPCVLDMRQETIGGSDYAVILGGHFQKHDTPSIGAGTDVSFVKTSDLSAEFPAASIAFVESPVAYAIQESAPGAMGIINPGSPTHFFAPPGTFGGGVAAGQFIYTYGTEQIANHGIWEIAQVVDPTDLRLASAFAAGGTPAFVADLFSGNIPWIILPAWWPADWNLTNLYELGGRVLIVLPDVMSMAPGDYFVKIIQEDGQELLFTGTTFTIP